MNESMQWVPPTPLRPNGTNLLPFPVNVLPPIIGDMADAIATTTSTDVAIAGTSILSAVSYCFSGVYRMSAKRDHTEPLVLDTLTIAEPSFKKSPVISMIKRPYIQFAHDWNENNKQDIFKSQAEYKLLQGKLESLEKKKDVTAEEIDTLHDYGEKLYTFYNDGYRSLAGFTESYPNFCCEENGYAIYYNQPDFNWGQTIYTQCVTPVPVTQTSSILFSYRSGAADVGEMWLVPKSGQSMSPAETARYIHETIMAGQAVSLPFNWLQTGDNYTTVLIDCGNITAGDYYLAWKAVTDNTHPYIRNIKVLEV